MKHILRLLLALGLTLPLYLQLVDNHTVTGWIFSDPFYPVVAALNRLAGAEDVVGRVRVVEGIILIASFLISCALVGLVVLAAKIIAAEGEAGDKGPR